MAINAQSGVGRIRLFNDWFGGLEILDADTRVTNTMGDFKIVGEGQNASDVQATLLESDALSGVIQIETDDTNKYSTCIVSSVGFDVGLMGTLVLEARVRFTDLDTKVMFVGFSDVNTDDMSIEDDLFDVTGITTIENTASDMVGFYFQTELTAGESIHACYNGGTTSADTDTTNNDLGVNLVAGEFMLLRLEVDNNGTARWYINEVLKKTLAGAVSTTTDLASCVGVGTLGNQELMDIDYKLVTANRDWNA